MAKTHLEREDKYDVDASFQLPAQLTDEDAGAVHLESTYYDTAEHDLLRQHVNLRHRTGDTDTGWHLKIPHGTARLEVRLPDDAGSSDVPQRLRELVAGLALGAPLVTTAVLRTERHRWAVRTGDRVLAEIADDTVHAVATGETATMSQWREIEVERVDGDERDLRRIGKQLRSAGAIPSTTDSKLRRALSQPAPAEPAAGSANELVTSYLRDQVAALVAGDVALRRGQDRVHKTRVAARRIRSVLRVFRKVLDADRAEHLDRELSWFQDLLGAVRDAQVQRARLTDAVAQLPPELVLGPVRGDIESAMVAAHAVALAEVRAALRSDRYLDLLRAVRSWTEDLPLRPGTSVADLQRLGKQAERRSRRRLRRGVERGGPDLHRARKAAKRSRYAMELLRPALGSPARKSIKRHKALQDVLGDYQDSVVASSHLRRLGAAGGERGRNGFTFGLLFACEEQQRRALLREAGRTRI